MLSGSEKGSPPTPLEHKISVAEILESLERGWSLALLWQLRARASLSFGLHVCMREVFLEGFWRESNIIAKTGNKVNLLVTKVRHLYSQGNEGAEAERRW